MRIPSNVGIILYLTDETASLTSNCSDTTEAQDESDPALVDVPLNEIETIMSAVDTNTSELQRELLGHHYHLKHLPFADLKKLAQKNVIP